MKIKINRIGETKFGKWCIFTAIINENYIIKGIASYEENIELEEDKIYTEYTIFQTQRNGRTYYKLINS